MDAERLREACEAAMFTALPEPYWASKVQRLVETITPLIAEAEREAARMALLSAVFFKAAAESDEHVDPNHCDACARHFSFLEFLNATPLPGDPAEREGKA